MNTPIPEGTSPNEDVARAARAEARHKRRHRAHDAREGHGLRERAARAEVPREGPGGSLRKMAERSPVDLQEIGEILVTEVRRRPVAAVATAFGLGVCVSHVFTSRLARMALLAAGGYVTKELFGERLIEILREEGEELLDLAEDRQSSLDR
jgi:hypothetical protein